MAEWHAPLKRWTFPVAGAIAGVLGATLFLAMHAVLLVPIWFSLARAVVTGAVGGAVIGYAFGVLAVQDLHRPSLRRGAAFGACLWLALLPPSVVELALKTVVPTVADPVDVALVLTALVLPTGIGAWHYGRARRAVATAIVALIVLFVATGGPLGPAQFRRGAWLLVGFLPIFIMVGVCLTLMLRGLASASWPGEVRAKAG